MTAGRRSETVRAIRVLLPALLLAAACASSGAAGSGGAAETGPELPSTRVRLINRHAENVTAYAVDAALRERLGRIPGRTQRSFTFPWDPRRPLRIELEFTRGGRCTLGPYTVERGVGIELEIPAGLDPRSCD